MRHSTFFLAAAVLVGLAVRPATAVEPIRFARTPDISPDGKFIAFSYLGDIFTVETIGGTARPVTSHPAHDINPAFSPDGQHLAFSSNRHGSYDVFLVSARGGKPRRLTFDSAADLVCGWSPDGKSVLFASTRGVGFPPTFELYAISVDGGPARRISAGEGKEGVYSPRGDQIAYVRGPGSWYRKGYRGSSNDDVWLCNADGSNNRRLTLFNGQDFSPMWGADGTAIFYVSESFGTANIVRQPAAPTSAPLRPTQLTHHTDESVRKARISKNGETIVYECGPDLWVVGTREGCKPRKLAIEVNADDKANNERVVTLDRGATEFAVSHDEKHLAFAVHGRLFRMPVSPNGKATPMTFGSSNDHGIAWAPDNSRIIFISDRNGHDDLYALEADDPDHPQFLNAHKFKVRQLTDTREAEFGVSFSPDGKRVAFIRGGKLWTMAPDGKDQKVVVNDVQVFDYEWSPDSKWVVFARRDGSFASELYIVPAGGATAADPIRNVTRYATFNAGVTWSADGRRLAFLSDRRGGANLHVMNLEKPAATGGTAGTSTGGGSPFGRSPLSWVWDSRRTLTIDWEDVHLRARPVVRGFVDEAAISPDGTKVAFRDVTHRDLWVASATGGSLTRLTTGSVTPRQIHWSKRRSILGGSIELIYFLDGQGQLRIANAAGGEPKAGENKTLQLPYKVRLTVRQDEMYKEMFDQSWRFLSENFYDDKSLGRTWDEVRKRYRPLVQHVAMKEDLYALLYLMMGELNASHLGVSGFIAAPEEETAELGLLFDETYRGKGLKIAEVLKRGPADRKGIALKAGDHVVAIDGVAVDDKVNLSRLLNSKVGEVVVLHVVNNPLDPKERRRRVELTGLHRYTSRTHRGPGATDLMYDRWVARNAARVQQLSAGRLGYIHIPSMDEEGLDRFVRSLYSDNYDKDAIVLDVRFNGGGFTHDQVLNYLGSKEHTIFKNRDGGSGVVLRAADRKWHKPLVLLINNRSYSDAEIFPNAFRTLGLGKLVGEPTGGFVIGTSAVRLVDGSSFRIPRIGVYTTRGVNMDKEGVQPDVLVEPHPDQLARGVDAQLERAVDVLKADVVVWKKKREAETVAATGRDATKTAPKSGTTPAVTTPMRSPR